jgi:mRNA-degrading endonuclease RelE of RelBE toxin-antitoxin system
MARRKLFLPPNYGMNNLVFVSHAFKRDIKPLSKKYHTLRSSIDKLIEDLKLDPFASESYGSGIYKIRLSDSSKGKGQSGGFRVMYYHLSINDDGINILLLTIYNKSEISTIKKQEALKMLKKILDEHESGQ